MTLIIIKSIDKNSNSGIISDTVGSPQTFKELNMPRTKIEIDKFQLMTIINRVENANTFTTRNALAEAVAAEFPLDISSAVILLRIKEFGIEPKTPKGKRGRPAGIGLSTTQKDKMQAGRKKKVIGNIAEMKKDFPESRHGLIDRVGKGSKTAALKAMCLSCVQFQTKEITNCTCISCPIWGFRPYQKK